MKHVLKSRKQIIIVSVLVIVGIVLLVFLSRGRDKSEEKKDNLREEISLDEIETEDGLVNKDIEGEEEKTETETDTDTDTDTDTGTKTEFPFINPESDKTEEDESQGNDKNKDDNHSDETDNSEGDSLDDDSGKYSEFF